MVIQASDWYFTLFDFFDTLEWTFLESNDVFCRLLPMFAWLWFKWGVSWEVNGSIFLSVLWAPDIFPTQLLGSLQLTNAWEIPTFCALKVNTSKLALPHCQPGCQNDQYWGGLIIQIDAKEFVANIFAHGLERIKGLICLLLKKYYCILFLWNLLPIQWLNVIGNYLHVLWDT